MSRSAGADVDPSLLRRVALAAGGLHRAAPFGRGRSGTLRAVEHLGYVQIDTISVIARAHEHVLLTRVPNYRSGDLDALVTRGKLFEYWAHAAAYLPMSDYRFALPRMERLRGGDQLGYWGGRRPRMMDEVLARIRAEGPLRARDFETPPDHAPGWWSWKPAKHALERLFHEGLLMVAGRDGFEKRYDLTERVLPETVDTRSPSLEEYAHWLVERARRGLGVFDAPHVTHLRREAGIRPAVAAAIDAALQDGRLLRVRHPAGGRPLLADRGALDGRAPRLDRRLRVLSPFDNGVIHRDRIARLFGFDYQLECYVPEAKRRYGYFTLPLLRGTGFIGRLDCKAERDAGVFRIRHLQLEPGVAAPEPEAILAAVAPLAHHDACTLACCDRVTADDAGGRALQRALRRPRPLEAGAADDGDRTNQRRERS